MPFCLPALPVLPQKKGKKKRLERVSEEEAKLRELKWVMGEEKEIKVYHRLFEGRWKWEVGKGKGEEGDGGGMEGKGVWWPWWAYWGVVVRELGRLGARVKKRWKGGVVVSWGEEGGGEEKKQGQEGQGGGGGRLERGEEEVEVCVEISLYLPVVFLAVKVKEREEKGEGRGEGGGWFRGWVLSEVSGVVREGLVGMGYTVKVKGVCMGGCERRCGEKSSSCISSPSPSLSRSDLSSRSSLRERDSSSLPSSLSSPSPPQGYFFSQAPRRVASFFQSPSSPIVSPPLSHDSDSPSILPFPRPLNRKRYLTSASFFEEGQPDDDHYSRYLKKMGGHQFFFLTPLLGYPTF